MYGVCLFFVRAVALFPLEVRAILLKRLMLLSARDKRMKTNKLPARSNRDFHECVHIFTHANYSLWPNRLRILSDRFYSFGSCFLPFPHSYGNLNARKIKSNAHN